MCFREFQNKIVTAKFPFHQRNDGGVTCHQFGDMRCCHMVPSKHGTARKHYRDLCRESIASDSLATLATTPSPEFDRRQNPNGEPQTTEKNGNQKMEDMVCAWTNCENLPLAISAKFGGVFLPHGVSFLAHKDWIKSVTGYSESKGSTTSGDDEGKGRDFHKLLSIKRKCELILPSPLGVSTYAYSPVNNFQAISPSYRAMPSKTANRRLLRPHRQFYRNSKFGRFPLALPNRHGDKIQVRLNTDSLSFRRGEELSGYCPTSGAAIE
jgi:hypothetical protein